MMNELIQIEQVRTRYKASLQEKADMVDRCWLAVTESTRPLINVMQEIHGKMHKLAGSAGMYGYTDVSNLASSVMHDIDAEDRSNLERKLLRLRNLLQEYSQR